MSTHMMNVCGKFQPSNKYRDIVSSREIEDNERTDNRRTGRNT